MKNKILIILSIVLFSFFLKFTFMKDRVTDIEYVYEQQELTMYDVYYYDESKLVSVEVAVDNDVIYSLFDLLSNKSNSIKEDYDTKIITSTKLLNYESNDKLILNLTDDFLRYNEDNSYQIINQLKYTFSNLGYTSLFIKVENELLEYIGDVSIKDGITLSNI